MTEDEIKRLKPGDKIRYNGGGFSFFTLGRSYEIKDTLSPNGLVMVLDDEGDKTWMGASSLSRFNVVTPQPSTTPDDYQRREIAYRLCKADRNGCPCRDEARAPCPWVLREADEAIALGARVEPKPDPAEELAKELYVSLALALGTLTLWESLALHVQDAWRSVARHAIAKLAKPRDEGEGA